MCANTKIILFVSSSCISSFSLVQPTIVFRMLINMAFLWPRFGDVEGCVWVLFSMDTSIALTHDVACTVAQASSRSFNDLSQVLCLSLASLVSHTEYMLSWWFEVSYRWVMLSVCSEVRVCTSSLAHTLSHFDEFWRPDHPPKAGPSMRCIV